MDAYVIEQQSQRCSVKMNGDLTAVLVPNLQATLKAALANGAQNVIFDLRDTVMLDSSGMGLLIATANSLAPLGGKVRVVNVGSEIFRLLQSMRLATRLSVSAA